MKFATAASFRTSLETRLLDRARREGKDVNRLRTQVAFERFLERVFRAQGDWVLKGGYALEVRLHDRARSTLDLDLDAGSAADLLGVLLLVVFSTLCGGLGLLLLVYHWTTPGASWLYYLPTVLFFGALGFCSRGLNFLSQAADHLNAGEALAKQASGPEIQA